MRNNRTAAYQLHLHLLAGQDTARGGMRIPREAVWELAQKRQAWVYSSMMKFPFLKVRFSLVSADQRKPPRTDYRSGRFMLHGVCPVDKSEGDHSEVHRVKVEHEVVKQTAAEGDEHRQREHRLREGGALEQGDKRYRAVIAVG